MIKKIKVQSKEENSSLVYLLGIPLWVKVETITSTGVRVIVKLVSGPALIHPSQIRRLKQVDLLIPQDKQIVQDALSAIHFE